MGNLKNLEIEERDMGYRSEVVLAVSKPMVPHFLTVLAQHESARTLIKDADQLEENYQEGGMLMHWSGIKWYESYPEIAAIESFVADCENERVEGWAPEEEHDTEYDHFRFVRIGEETSDVEEKGGFADCDICVTRAVNF
tara:strand:+ start:788 stop:1207 length:420 start_codon:yes stop_codon:yes gene_type:complete